MNEELIAQIGEALVKREGLSKRLQASGEAKLVIPMAIDGWDYNVTVHFERKDDGC